MFRCVQTYFIEKYPYTVYSLIFSLILTVSVIVFDVKTVSEMANLVILKQMALYILFVPPQAYMGQIRKFSAGKFRGVSQTKMSSMHKVKINFDLC